MLITILILALVLLGTLLSAGYLLDENWRMNQAIKQIERIKNSAYRDLDRASSEYLRNIYEELRGDQS